MKVEARGWNWNQSRGSAVRLDRERPQLTTEEARVLYPPEDCLLDEMVHRLRADGSWKKRRMILHPSCILVIDIDEDLVIDCITTNGIDECVSYPEKDDHVNNLRAFRIVMLPQDTATPHTVLDCRCESEASASIWVDKISGQVNNMMSTFIICYTGCDTMIGTILQAERVLCSGTPQ